MRRSLLFFPVFLAAMISVGAAQAATCKLLPIGQNAIVQMDNDVSSVAMTPDGNKLATGSWETVRVTDVKSGEILCEVQHGNAVTSVAITPDGSKLITGSYDGIAKVTDVKSGEILREVKHDGGVRTVAITPDGSKLAT